MMRRRKNETRVGVVATAGSLEKATVAYEIRSRPVEVSAIMPLDQRCDKYPLQGHRDEPSDVGKLSRVTGVGGGNRQWHVLQSHPTRPLHPCSPTNTCGCCESLVAFGWVRSAHGWTVLGSLNRRRTWGTPTRLAFCPQDLPARHGGTLDVIPLLDGSDGRLQRLNPRWVPCRRVLVRRRKAACRIALPKVERRRAHRAHTASQCSRGGPCTIGVLGASVGSLVYRVQSHWSSFEDFSAWYRNVVYCTSRLLCHYVYFN
jgi:hypothetical protein